MRSLIILLLISLRAGATDYYVASNGNNSNLGVSTIAPWQTISKVNSSLQNGDRVFFRKGDTWNETLVLNRINITISSYGTGAKPVFNGLVTLTAWSSIGGGVYECAVAAKNTLNMVTIDGLPVAVGRYPNTGYGTVTGFSGNTQYTSAIFNGQDWRGGEVLSKKEGYVLERDKIIAQSGATITYTTLPTINPRNSATSNSLTPNGVGNGIFIQRHPATLDAFGEWYFDTTTRRLKMYFGAANPASYTIKASVLDTLININTRAGATIDGIELVGANLAGIYFADNSNCTIKNCKIYYNGAKGIFGWNAPNTLIENCDIKYSMCSAIDVVQRNADGITLRYNVVDSSGYIPGMGSFFNDGDYKAVYTSARNNTTITKNRVSHSGYVGIQFQGANVLVDSNYVDYFCFIKDDGAGIYTFADTIRLNRVIQHNIVLNGIGAPEGNRNPVHAEGIYGDGESAHMIVKHNTVAGIINRAIYNNDPKTVTVDSNLTYNSFGWGINKHHDGDIRAYRNTNNIYFYGPKPPGNDQTYSNGGINSNTEPLASNIQQALQRVGYIDSNVYHLPIDNVFMWFYAPSAGGNFTFVTNNPYSFWKSYTLHDANSSRLTTTTGEIFAYNDADTIKTVKFIGFRKIDPRGNVFDDSAHLDQQASNIYIANGLSPGINTPPIVDAGASVLVTLPNDATVTGTASDPGGSISSVEWMQLTGPLSLILSPNTLSTGIHYTQQGIYSYRLIATDNGGAVASDTTFVTVNQAPVVTANAGPDVTIQLPVNTTTLTGSGQNATSFVWSGTAVNSPSTAVTSVGPLTQGVFRYILTVNGTVRDTAFVTVLAAVPLAPWINAIPPQTIQLPLDSVTVTAVAGDNDGTVTGYQWTGNGGTIVSPTSATTIIRGLLPGTYVYTVTVTDNSGLTASRQVTINVRATNAAYKLKVKL